MSKRAITASDISESIQLYIGEENDKILKETPADVKKLFKSLKLDVHKSCLVKGDSTLLKQFKAFFVLESVHSRTPYSTFMLKDYVQGLTDSLDDEAFLVGSERDLLFLYLHGGQAGFGNTEPWMWATTVDRVANRNRKKLVTVILTEREVPALEEATSELIIYNLGGAVKAQIADAVAKSVSKKEDTNGNDTVGSYTTSKSGACF